MKSSKKPQLKHKLYDYALFQLAISPKSEFGLIQKLKQKRRRLDPTLPIDPIIKKLKRLGFLDDQVYLEYFLRRHPLWSSRRLSYELKRQHIDYQAPFGSDLKKIKKIISKQATKDKNKLFAKLSRLGFSLSDVIIAFDESVKRS